MEGCRLIFTPEALRKVAELAKARQTGARGLRSILEQAMLDIMYKIPSRPEITEVVITEGVVDGNGGAGALYREGRLTTSSSSWRLSSSAA